MPNEFSVRLVPAKMAGVVSPRGGGGGDPPPLIRVGLPTPPVRLRPDREVEVHSVVSVGGFGCASLHRFVEMMGEGEAVSVGCFRAICLAPQLVCGCSTRAPLTFFLAWGGWRQRSVWRHCVVLG